MRIGVYPGSFDPVTFGHLDIIDRSSKLFDKLIVGVLENSAKKPIFTSEERIIMLQETLGDRKNIEVKTFSGLLVDFMKQEKAQTIVRGLRAVSDFEYEMQIAHTNHALNGKIDTVFFTTNLMYAFLSSSIVREIASYHGKLHTFVPENVEKALIDKFRIKE